VKSKDNKKIEDVYAGMPRRIRCSCHWKPERSMDCGGAEKRLKCRGAERRLDYGGRERRLDC